ncbi:hypothetical protein HAX54_047967 [Datura stramonium]|uniref:Uncharacterized protein n=1 Tax=Datura stramonium TaxID=4076 RepID=A0ABS8WMN0_DATST|nr:hypothetical protein [Datura stramonium]
MAHCTGVVDLTVGMTTFRQVMDHCGQRRGLTMRVTARHPSDGLSFVSIGLNPRVPGMTVGLMDRCGSEDPSFPANQDPLFLIRVMKRLTDHRACDGLSCVPLGRPIVEFQLNL